jgi:hypothetical protein
LLLWNLAAWRRARVASNTGQVEEAIDPVAANEAALRDLW